MRIEIIHRTQYAYSSPVVLEPHCLRVRPRYDPLLDVHAFDLEMDPWPAGMSEYVDLDGNSVLRVWFTEPVTKLFLRARMVVETRRSDPFAFLLQASATSLPIRWSLRDDQQLAVYRMRRHPSRPVDDLVAELIDEVGGVTTLFLTGLARRIAASCRQVRRPTGEPNTPSITLMRQSGACRDLAVLFVDAARAAGLPARFVSGYTVAEASDPTLHAWAEVYLPGAGWLGFDPTQGLAVADCHVAMAAAADPRDASMLEGSFLGKDAVSTLSAAVDMRLPLAAS